MVNMGIFKNTILALAVLIGLVVQVQAAPFGPFGRMLGFLSTIARRPMGTNKARFVGASLVASAGGLVAAKTASNEQSGSEDGEYIPLYTVGEVPRRKDRLQFYTNVNGVVGTTALIPEDAVLDFVAYETVAKPNVEALKSVSNLQNDLRKAREKMTKEYRGSIDLFASRLRKNGEEVKKLHAALHEAMEKASGVRKLSEVEKDARHLYGLTKAEAINPSMRRIIESRQAVGKKYYLFESASATPIQFSDGYECPADEDMEQGERLEASSTNEFISSSLARYIADKNDCAATGGIRCRKAYCMRGAPIKVKEDGNNQKVEQMVKEFRDMADKID